LFKEIQTLSIPSLTAPAFVSQNIKCQPNSTKEQVKIIVSIIQVVDYK
jgi:hypothetical protein